jgi:hypothetical protein
MKIYRSPFSINQNKSTSTWKITMKIYRSPFSINQPQFSCKMPAFSPGGRPTWGVSPGGALEEEKKQGTALSFVSDVNQ